MLRRCFQLAVVLTMLLILASPTRADVRLPGFFTDHMVLQQKMKIRIWGWADEGEQVQIALGETTASATANNDGRWAVELPALKGSKTPHTLKVSGKNTIELKDVLIGEVWLCSGQSNMEWSVRSSANAKNEIAAANYNFIRHMKIAHRPSPVPLDDVPSQWQVCSSDTAPNFTACGYFMARKLYEELDVPIGLINSSWGGTRVEPWAPTSGFAKVPELKAIHTSVLGRTPGSEAFKAGVNQHIQATQEWIANAKDSLAKNTPISTAPTYPASLVPFKSHQDPTMLYNGMIHALVGYSMRGAIWYQGESNHTEQDYFEKKKALINGWRDLWKQGDFPFYYVQIAPFQYGNEDPVILARFWQEQSRVQELPNTGMVVINDIATLKNIHPPNKQDVGLRLANLALRHDYGREEVVAHSPEMERFDIVDGRLRLSFKNAGGGLKTRDGKSASHFEIIGPGSGGFQPANAEIDGSTLTLSSDKVLKPVAFRFAWHKLAEPNLTGGTGLPVGAFRGGEMPTFLNQLPLDREYKLVYDLDLSKLGAKIEYDVDNSASIGAFDRVGYLVELRNAGGDSQDVFVSMKAFTEDLKKIGIPTASTNATFQTGVEDLDVFSNVSGVATGRALKTGNIEFWSNNYSPTNKAGVRGASSSAYDFGDQMYGPRDGYGSMQVHNHGKRQTIFAINHWRQGARADIGIGNSTGENRDWTFRGNAGSYPSKRLRVYVRTK